MPVLVPAGLWNPAERSLTEFLTDYLAATYPALRAPTGNGPTLAAELTRMRLVVPVIDGLDEIAAVLRPVAIRRINIELDAASPVVLTARGREYEDAVHAAGGDVLMAAAVVELHPLRPEEVQNHLGGVVAPHRLGQWHPVFTCLDEEPSGALATAALNRAGSETGTPTEVRHSAGISHFHLLQFAYSRGSPTDHRYRPTDLRYKPADHRYRPPGPSVRAFHENVACARS